IACSAVSGSGTSFSNDPDCARRTEPTCVADSDKSRIPFPSPWLSFLHASDCPRAKNAFQWNKNRRFGKAQSDAEKPRFERPSPSLQRKIVYAGTTHGSFELGKQALQELADVVVTTKQVERLTEHIGSERLAERNEAVAAFAALPLTEKHQSPAGVASPKV